MGGFLDDFVTMSTFGATARGGVDRQAATSADGKTREWFAGWLKDSEIRVEIDRIGNVFGLVEFLPGAPYILVGSHLDSQPLAGRFDGAYGVLAGAHAVRRVRDGVRAGDIVPAFNLAVVDWFNEEGSRFKPSMMGSSVFTGTLAPEVALATTDPAGISVAEALDDIALGRGDYAGPEVAAYAEIHVEQGRELDNTGVAIGLVATTWTAQKLEVVVTGEQAHTGAAPMADRRDALFGAARVIVATRELIDGFAEEELHTAVSELYVYPNSPVTLAREVRMLIDLRSPSQEILEAAVARLREQLAVIEDEARVQVTISGIVKWSSGPFLEEGLQLTARAAADLGLSHRRVATVAGHDATNMKVVVPTVMLFVPSVEGISHNEREFTTDEQMVGGVELLTVVVQQLVEGRLEAAGARASE